MLTPRQIALYTEIASIYRPTLAYSPDGRMKSTEGSYVRIIASIPCLWCSKQFSNLPTVLGVGQDDNFFTLDHFKFDVVVDVKSQDIIVIESSAGTALSRKLYQYRVSDPGRQRFTRGVRSANDRRIRCSLAPDSVKGL